MSRAIVGRVASEGLAFGPTVALTIAEVPDDLPTDAEFADVARATATRLEELARRLRDEERTEEADVLEAYAMMATDPALAKDVAARTLEGVPLVAAIRAAIAGVAAAFAAMDDEYFRQRADDVGGVGRELVATVADTGQGLLTFPDGAIICAVDLTPADTVRIDLERVGGLATERGGPTSHTAIVARSAGIPALVGVTGLLAALEDDVDGDVDGDVEGRVVLLDAERGEFVIDPDVATLRDADLRMGVAKELVVLQRKYHGHRTTFDGERILVAANAGGTNDVSTAAAAAADGIGLLRSEFLFLERTSPPTLEEQTAAYREAVAAFDDPTVIRTLDIGGDKDVAYLDLPVEENPFLGVRGLRLCLEHPELFEVQLDALLAAGDADGLAGRLKVMLPMVSSIGDLAAGAARLEERAVLAGAAPPPLGVMIETPAAALLAPHFARRVAFFSIGTNDLVQYVTAADRTNGALGGHQDPSNPAVLQLIDRTCRAADAAGIETAVCGEAASDPVTAAVMLGLGVRELSVAASRIDRVRWLIDQLDPRRVRKVARLALELPDADAVRELVSPLLP